MRLQKKSLSRVTLADLLRRKRSTLQKFLKESGIVTYELLVSRCASMGVVPPEEKDFLEARGNPTIHDVSSPTEGIVVLEPPPVDETVTQGAPSEDAIVEEPAETSPATVSFGNSKKKNKKNLAENSP